MVALRKEGRRIYITGDTYALRAKIKAAGGHWDGDKKAWWVSKPEVAQEIAAAASSTPAASPPATVGARKSETLSDDSTVAGRARYKGREYLLVWEGTTSRGAAAKLAFLDGTNVFWADGSAIQVTKRYQSQERRGRDIPMTFGRLRVLREEFSAQQAAAKDCDLVGARGEYSSQFSAERANRTPSESIGEATWLRHGKVRIAVVLVGYEPATYVRSEDAEDMGHFGVTSGWYGVAHYRAATVEEFVALQAAKPREDGSCVETVAAVVAALASVGGAS